MQTDTKIHGAAPVLELGGCAGVPAGASVPVGAGVWQQPQHAALGTVPGQGPSVCPLAVLQAAITAADSSEKRG